VTATETCYGEEPAYNPANSALDIFLFDHLTSKTREKAYEIPLESQLKYAVRRIKDRGDIFLEAHQHHLKRKHARELKEQKKQERIDSILKD
jgi:hypothetical protein